MRSKTLTLVLLSSGVGLAVVLLAWMGNNSTPRPTLAPAQIPPATSSVGETANNQPPAANAAPRPAATAAPTEESRTAETATASEEQSNPLEMTPEAKQQAYVEARIQELADLGAADDLDSLNTLLSELGNHNPEIRKAALQAIVQFDSVEAIPKLEDAILQTDDPHEKAAIADAIDYLQLPSITELRGKPNQAKAH